MPKRRSLECVALWRAVLEIACRIMSHSWWLFSFVAVARRRFIIFTCALCKHAHEVKGHRVCQRWKILAYAGNEATLMSFSLFTTK